jgi:hypothetical protein
LNSFWYAHIPMQMIFLYINFIDKDIQQCIHNVPRVL